MNNILFEASSGVAKITLNRPDVLNSFNASMAQEMLMVLAAVGGDPNVRSVLITGAGRSFCAGQDLDEVLPRDGSPGIEDLGSVIRARYNPIILGIRNLAKPVICAVNGVAAGAGANLALACDIVLASERAAFIQSFCKVGLIPDSGGTFFLPRLVGLAQATALTMLGEKLTAKEAQNIGLVYKVYEESVLIDEATKLAAYLAQQPTQGLALTKQALTRSFANDLEAQLKLEEELQQKAGRTYDYKEGTRAFLEKREPKFLGK